MAAARALFCCAILLLPAISDAEVVQVEVMTGDWPMLIQVKKDMAQAQMAAATTGAKVETKHASAKGQTPPNTLSPTHHAEARAPEAHGIHKPMLKAPMANVALAMTSTSTNSTATAFGQIAELATEFRELREDDNSHVRQLLFNVQLREQLRAKLREVDDQLASDNMRLAQKTAQIGSTGSAGSQGSDVDESSPESADETSGMDFEHATNSSVAALLQSATRARESREINNEKVAAQVLDRVKELIKDITALRKRDDDEVQSLSMNSKSRETLESRIGTRIEQLRHDAGDLLVDLGKIRELAQQGQGQEEAADQSQTAQASFAQQGQQDGGAYSQPQAGEVAPAGVSETASQQETAEGQSTDSKKYAEALQALQILTQDARVARI